MRKNTNTQSFEPKETDTASQAGSAAPTVMSWSTKTIAASPKEIMKTQCLIIVMCAVPFLIALWHAWGDLEKKTDLLIIIGAGMAMFAIYLITLIVRQKTIFNYIITIENASVEYYFYYPDFAGYLFKSIAITVLLLFFGMTIYTGSLWFLVGPVAMALGAARFLLVWENKVFREKAPSWDRYNYVTIDYKRLMIVMHTTDQAIGFEFRFPSTKLLEQYLLLLQALLNKNVIYTEKSWDWDLSLKSFG